MATYNNINSFISAYQSRLDSLPQAIELSVLDTHARMAQRIFDKGENVDGKTFNYKTPAYRNKRKNSGKQVSFVDFKFTNDLQSDFRGSSSSDVRPTKVNDQTFRIELNRSINVVKKDGLDDRYDTVFEITKKEQESFKDILRKEVNFRLGA